MPGGSIFENPNLSNGGITIPKKKTCITLKNQAEMHFWTISMKIEYLLAFSGIWSSKTSVKAAHCAWGTVDWKNTSSLTTEFTESKDVSVISKGCFVS